MSNKAILAAFGAAAIFGAITAAVPARADVVLTGGTLGSAPSASATNELFGPLYGGSPQPGWFFGDLSTNSSNFVYGALELTTTSEIDFAYLGKEAGFTNSFEINTGSGWVSLKTVAGGTDIPGTPEDLGTYTFGPGVVEFRFSSNGLSNYATNGGTAVGSGYTSQASIFVTFLGGDLKPLADQSKGAGDVVGNVFDVFYDDSGAFNDDNHDDFAVRFTVTAVPVPAALPIIGAALAGFGFAGFRERRSA